MRRLALLAALCLALTARAHEPADWVDPFVGTTNFGTTNPGALCPNGMMSVVPFNVMGSDTNVYDKDARWWSTPYEFHNKFFTGYAHVALSGVGCPDLGSLLTMPTAGELCVDYKLYGSAYDDERAAPGYYANRLTKYGIRTEATATLRSSAERYTFPAGQGHILLNLGEGLTNESGATVRRVSATEIEGSKLLGTFCYNPQKVFPVYFVLRVTKTPSRSGYWKKQRPMTGPEAQWTPDQGKYKLYTEYGRELSGDDVGYWFSFDDLQEGETVEVRMGVSFVSTENARANLDAEQRGRSFDALRDEARATWNADLGRIRVEGGTDAQRTVFYTALYHALIHPNILSDVNGEYPLMERSGEVGIAEGDRYTVFSLWDTYRNLHQLMTLVYPERQLEMVRSMVGMSKEWGWLPKWELYGRETFTMEGDPAIPVIVDTWEKGLRDFDVDAAYAAMKRSATTPGADNPMTSTPTSSGAISPSGGSPPTARATTRCRTRWSTTLPTTPWPAWPRRAAKRSSPPSCAAAPRGGATTTAPRAARCARSPARASSSRPSTRARARTSSRWPASTRDRPGTTPSSCRTTSRGWPAPWAAAASSSTSSSGSSTRGCTTPPTSPTSPTPTSSAASAARSGARSARCAGCSTSTSPRRRTAFPATTTWERCRPGPSSR